MNILQFSKHFQLIFDNSNVNHDKQIKQKIANFFSANFSELSNFSLSSFWEKPFWNQKLLLLTTTARRSCYPLVMPFPTLNCCPFFSQTQTNFSSSPFWEKPLWNHKLLLLTTPARRCFYTLVRRFFTNFFDTNFRYQNKNNVSETLLTSCQKNIAYIMCLNT